MKSRLALGIIVPMVLCIGASHAVGGECVVKPKPYARALRNPMKGLTAGSEWHTLSHTYISWKEIEDKESDGIDKIKAVCNKKWKDFDKKNMKAIPRVYLHWNGERVINPRPLAVRPEELRSDPSFRLLRERCSQRELLPDWFRPL